MFKRIRRFLDTLNRCRKYAHKLNQINHLLDKYERNNHKDLTLREKTLIKNIDNILG